MCAIYVRESHSLLVLCVRALCARGRAGPHKQVLQSAGPAVAVLEGDDHRGLPPQLSTVSSRSASQATRSRVAGAVRS